MPSRAHSETVMRTIKILGMSFGNPATWNDETIVLCYKLIKGVKMELSLRIVILHF